MNTALILLLIIAIMLLLERILTITACKTAAGRDFLTRHKIFHPNAISLMRIPMGVISILFVSQGHWYLGILWFAFWMITDITDGTIARDCNLQSDTGKWLDPLSDKCMSFPCLLYFALSSNVCPDSRLHLPCVIAFIILDSLGQASRLFTTKTAANAFGKAKTALITILLALAALNQLEVLLPGKFLNSLMYLCFILAFLSAYCKIIPDHLYANSLTLCNFLCGILAIFVAFKLGWYARAFGLVFLGQFFDLFDGRMARKYGSTKRGPWYDDIADATSFGLAIGSIIYCGLSRRAPVFNRYIALAVAIFYIICLFYRLYRFLKPTRKLPKGIFQGLPSPAGALAAGSLILVTFQFETCVVNYVAAILVCLISWLMISNLPYKHFGQTLWPNMPRAGKLLMFIALLIFANFAIVYRAYWECSFSWFCLLLSLAYLVGGIAKLPDTPDTPDKQ